MLIDLTRKTTSSSPPTERLANASVVCPISIAMDTDSETRSQVRHLS